MPGTRLFFIGCLLIGLVILVALTAGAFQPIGEVPDNAALGYTLWQANDCEGCHTLYGQGGAYAPDLTHIYDQRGAAYIREFLVSPNAFHPGQRLMPRLHITIDETSALIAFLQWVGETEAAANWPPRPIQMAGLGGLGAASLTLQADSSQSGVVTAAEQGQRIFSRYCATCHSLERDVVIVGPSLAGIGDRAWRRVVGVSAQQYIRDSILNPSDYIVDGFADVMQKNLAGQLSSEDMDHVVAFLMLLKEES